MKKNILFILLIFISISIYSQDLFLKERNNKFGYVDASGEVKIPFEYSFAFTDTLRTIAFIVTNDGRIRAIDRNNNQLFTVFNYDNGPDYLSEGLFRILDDTTKKIGFADMNGDILIPPSYSFIRPFRDGLAAFNCEGNNVIDTTKVDNHSFYLGGKWGYIDRKNKIIFPPIFDEITEFRNKKAKIRIGNHSFFLELVLDSTNYNNSRDGNYILIENKKK